MSVPVSGKCQDDIMVDMSILICPSSYRGVGNDNPHEIILIMLMKSKLQYTQ